jgi:hypothetical protein
MKRKLDANRKELKECLSATEEEIEKWERAVYLASTRHKTQAYK